MENINEKDTGKIKLKFKGTGNLCEFVGFNKDYPNRVIIRFNNGQSLGVVNMDCYKPVDCSWEELRSDKKYFL